MQVRAKGSIAKEYYQPPFDGSESKEGRSKKGNKEQNDNLGKNRNQDSYDRVLEEFEMQKYRVQMAQNYIVRIQEIQRQIQELERQKIELSKQYAKQYAMGQTAHYNKMIAQGIVKSYRLGIQTSKVVEAYEKNKTIAS